MELEGDIVQIVSTRLERSCASDAMPVRVKTHKREVEAYDQSEPVGIAYVS